VAGWPEVHVTCDDGDGGAIVWSGESAATDKKHSLNALVNTWMRETRERMIGQPLAGTQVSAMGFFGWGGNNPGAGGASVAGRANSVPVLATSSTT
jgi:hypothetical protein